MIAGFLATGSPGRSRLPLTRAKNLVTYLRIARCVREVVASAL
jgi:hypothetical protein